MYTTGVSLPKGIWDRTLEAIAAQASRQSAIYESVEFVHTATVFGEPLFKIRSEYPTLIDSIEVVSWRFR